MSLESYPCPCCGFLSFIKASGGNEICPICFWEDDIFQLKYPYDAGGANHCSLFQAQHQYQKLGASKERMLAYTRLPTQDVERDLEWRPIDSASDTFGSLHWQVLQHHSSANLYYWRPNYWLAQITTPRRRLLFWVYEVLSALFSGRWLRFYVIGRLRYRL